MKRSVGPRVVLRRLLAVVLLLLHAADGFDLDKCPIDALGMESGAIEDAQITASSSFDPQSVGPQNARIRTEKNSGAWCPKTQIRNSSSEFLQLNLGRTHVIRGIETQGRYGNGTGQEFAQAYLVDYWRAGIKKWIRWRSRSGATLIEGNADTVTAVLRKLDPPIVASKVRVIPHSTQTRTTCMRLEVYGCEYKDGPLFYSWSKPPPAEPEAENFTDETFEETEEVDEEYGSLKGLGLLTDGIVARNPPMDPLYRQPFRNGSWTAWRRNETDGRVELRFEFEREQHFAAVELFGFGRPIAEIEVDFAAGDRSNGTPVHFVYPTAVSNEEESEREDERKPENHYMIRVPLEERAGRILRLRLLFTTEWVYLSEIRFISDPSNGTSLLPNFPLDAADPFGLYYVLVAVLVVLFVVLSLALCVAMRRKSVGAVKLGGGTPEKLMITSSIGSPSSRSTAATSTLSHHDLLVGPPKSNALIATLGSKNGAYGGHPRHVVHSHSFAPHQQLLAQYNDALFLPNDPRAITTVGGHPQRALGVAPASRSCSGTMFAGMPPSLRAHDMPPSLLDINFPPPPPPLPTIPLPPSSTASTVRADGPSNSSSEGIYAEPSSTVPLLPNRRGEPAHRRPIPKPRSKDSLNRRNRTLPTRNRPNYVEVERTYDDAANSSVASSELMLSPTRSAHSPPLAAIDTADVELLERIGEGKFTQVFACRWRDRRTGVERRAAVKRLHVDNEAARLALMAEARVAADLNANAASPHLNRLHGQCGDLALVGEWAPEGDVRAFCQRQRANGRLDYARLLGFCSQIAAGMEELERLGVVHGHLSPKCCLLDADLRLRVAAPRGPNHHAQLRYSAPEAIILNAWSAQSDAYSFGVTAWEILHSCEHPPFPDLSNAELIGNARNQLDQSEQAIYPDATLNGVPDPEVVQLLRDCWATAGERPAFRESFRFLARKLLTASSGGGSERKNETR